MFDLSTGLDIVRGYNTSNNTFSLFVLLPFDNYDFVCQNFTKARSGTLLSSKQLVHPRSLPHCKFGHTLSFE